MKKTTILLIIVVGLVALLAYFLRGRSPAIPRNSESVRISLREPYTGELIVEKTVSDPDVIAAVAEAFSAARSGSDHKCASIGTISFLAGAQETTLEVLPGHDIAKYDFRLDGEMFCLPRESYINSLVAAGIDRDDIRLDGHPDVEGSAAGQSAAAAESEH